MKGIPEMNKKYLLLFFALICLPWVSACDGVTHSTPIINSFIASSTSITEGDNVTLSWETTDATTIYLKQQSESGVVTETVALSGSTTVSPAETTTYTLTATSSYGADADSITITVKAGITEQILTIQPGSAEGKDSYVSSLTPDFSYASNDYLSIGQSIFSTLGIHRDKITLDSYHLRAFLQFDLNALPADVVVVNAVLKLYQTASLDTSGLMIGVHQVTQEWEESTITWNNKPDSLTSPESTVTVPILVTGWLSWDISSLVQGWANGSIANLGIVLQDDGMAFKYIYINCYSSDYAGNFSLRPILEITYNVP
jgi:hypothetical protein